MMTKSQKAEKLILHLLSEKGFTLLELVVVMAIIAILAGALWGNFFTSLYKGRDARRKQDLDSIAKALELFYNDNKTYPSALPSPGTLFVNKNNTNVIYMQKVPTDPSADSVYCYPTIADGSSYKLYANLENRSDPKVMTTPTLCGNVYYNYGISSQNTMP